MIAVSTNFPWASILILSPLAGAILAFLWPAKAKSIGVITATTLVLAAMGLGLQLIEHGAYRIPVGGWGAPLGIDLYADGLSLMMLTITALVGLGISVFSTNYFKNDQAKAFWPIWLFLLAALNALFLSADIFNLYVTLEMVGLAAVSLVTVAGGKAALSGAMRYLLVSLLGSLLYLLGVALLYHRFGSLDIAILAEKIAPDATAWASFGLMCAGLLLKTALFPFHFWLPPAHTNAPAPVSAVLSALVVKASFYILLRLWLELFVSFSENVGEFFGLLGAIALIWGSLQALRQTRVKLLVAYSTVAQIGYMFLAFPLAAKAGGIVWNAVVYLMISHALAKSAMFLATGNLLHFGGHDRIKDLDRVAQRAPLTIAAFALAGVSIMGLPPSGGFIGKWLLLEEALSQGRWGLALVMLIGGLLAATYIFKVLGHAFTQASVPHAAHEIPVSMEWVALLLAIASVALGLIAFEVMPLMNLGTPFANSVGNP